MKKKISDTINKSLICFLKWKPPKLLIFTILLIFILFVSINCFRIDNDFWFLINLGKNILNNGFTRIEPFTIHNDFSFIIQQWLSDVIFYIIYSKFGVYGMMIFLSILICIIVTLIYKLCMLASENNVKISTTITIIITFLLNMYFITTRPQVFDILLLLCELYLLELYVIKNNNLSLFLLPIVSLLMINLHSSLWLMLFVFLLPYFAEKILLKSKYKLKPLIISTIIMLLVGLINPYGLDSIKYLFSSYGITEINEAVAEMQPLTVTLAIGYYIITFLVFISYYINKGDNKLRYLFLFLGTCYLGLSHYKGILFFLVGIVLSLSNNLNHLVKEEGIQEKYYKLKTSNLVIIIFMMCCVLLFGINLYSLNINEYSKVELYDIANYLDDNADKNIKLYTGYNVGGYLEYRGYKCYIDARAEVFLKANNKKEDIFMEYYNLQKNQLNINSFLNKYNFDYLVVRSSDILYNYLENSDDYIMVYEKIVEEECYRIYKKKVDNDYEIN